MKNTLKTNQEEIRENRRESDFELPVSRKEFHEGSKEEMAQTDLCVAHAGGSWIQIQGKISLGQADVFASKTNWCVFEGEQWFGENLMDLPEVDFGVNATWWPAKHWLYVKSYQGVLLN